MATKAKVVDPDASPQDSEFKVRAEEAYAALVEETKDRPGFIQETSVAGRNFLYTESINLKIKMLVVGTDQAACRIGFYYNNSDIGVVIVAKPGSSYIGHVACKGLNLSKEALLEIALTWLTATTVESLNRMTKSYSKAKSTPDDD